MENLRALIHRVQGGDIDAFGTIVQKFQNMAVGYAYSILGDFHLAEDAAQEAFINAYRDLHRLREPDAFPGWLRKIVFKQCDRLTRGKHIETVPLEAAADMPWEGKDPADEASAREMKADVLAAISDLPERERIVTTLFYINGYSQNEIADFLEAPVTTVNNRLHASRKRLKKGLTDMVRDNLQERRPSRDDQFVNTVQFFNAVEIEQLEKVKEHLRLTPELVNAKNSSGQTSLHVAAHYGYNRLMELLLANEAAVDARDKVGRTPLHDMARRCARIDVAELLLANGADVNATDKMGTTPASLAAYYEMKYGLWMYNRLKEFLLEKGVDPDIFVIMQDDESEKIEALLEAAPMQVNARLKGNDGTPGVTPLHFAVSGGGVSQYRGIAKILLKYGADPNALDHLGRPPLYLAYDDTMAELLLSHGAKLDIVSAAAIGRTEVVTELLSNDPTSIHAADAGGNTALHLAAWRRETEMVKLLLANGANPNLQNKRGEPPVSFALVRLCDCEVSYPRAIDIGHLLVKHGAKCDIWTAAKLESVEGLDACLRDDPTLLNAPNDEGLTPLQLASWLASWTSAQPVMEFLLKKGAALDICTAVQLGEKKQIMALLDADPTLVNTRTVEESTPLHLAARNGDEALVRCLVERGAAIDAKDSWWGCTPLLLAGHRKYQPIVEFLLEQGADINARDKEGCSLLHWAMTWADTEFVKSLISRGADLNAKNVQHATPMYKPATALHAAAFEGNVELVEFFLEQGLDIHDGELNWTLLHIAAMLGHMAVAQFLLERGANINIQSERDGFTPLHKALHRGQKAVAELLISRGADVNIRDNWGWTPLRLAIKGCHKDVADLLHQHGATA